MRTRLLGLCAAANRDSDRHDPLTTRVRLVQVARIAANAKEPAAPPKAEPLARVDQPWTRTVTSTRTRG
jgi:hypothetical protein